jgi:hypothetical protein
MLVALIGMLGALKIGILVLGPYLLIVLLLMVQFFRPTVLGWGLSFGLFLAYAVAVFAQGPLTSEGYIFILLGLLPAAAIAWAYPRKLTHDEG